MHTWGLPQLAPVIINVMNLPVPLRRAGQHRQSAGRMVEEGQAERRKATEQVHVREYTTHTVCIKCCRHVLKYIYMYRS